MELDQIDRIAAGVLDGYLVRKDLVRTFSRQFPVPTYVVEFMLGRYCASTDDEEINEGIGIVERQLKSRTIKAGEEELFKARAREEGDVKLVDLISARLDTRTDSYVATLPSLQLCSQVGCQGRRCSATCTEYFAAQEERPRRPDRMRRDQFGRFD